MHVSASHWFQLDSLRFSDELFCAVHCSWLGIYGHSRFCNTDTEDIVGLHESIRRLNGLYARATMSFAPDEPYKLQRPLISHS